MRYYYAMHDACPQGVRTIAPHQACDYNARQFGIFFTPNLHRNGKRTKAQLVSLRACFIDIDKGSKPELLNALLSCSLVPTAINETKRGYHAFWRLDKATIEQPIYRVLATWEAVQHGLVDAFQADPNARDASRMLRVPGFLHWKDPLCPFKIRAIRSHPGAYSLDALHAAFVTTPSIVTAKPLPPHDRPFHPNEPFRSQARPIGGLRPGDLRLNELLATDQRLTLARLSRHPMVNGEAYAFRTTARGHHNIYVNGKLTSCFIDAHGRIGSLSGGGPSIYQWLRWFGHEPRDIFSILKSLFPEFIVPQRSSHGE